MLSRAARAVPKRREAVTSPVSSTTMLVSLRSPRVRTTRRLQIGGRPWRTWYKVKIYGYRSGNSLDNGSRSIRDSWRRLSPMVSGTFCGRCHASATNLSLSSALQLSQLTRKSSCAARSLTLCIGLGRNATSGSCEMSLRFDRAHPIALLHRADKEREQAVQSFVVAPARDGTAVEKDDRIHVQLGTFWSKLHDAPPVRPHSNGIVVLHRPCTARALIIGLPTSAAALASQSFRVALVKEFRESPDAAVGSVQTQFRVALLRFGHHEATGNTAERSGNQTCMTSRTRPIRCLVHLRAVGESEGHRHEKEAPCISPAHQARRYYGASGLGMCV
ncbi:hypothetical protein VTK73DRAFT_2448 [Phialemonium thermophilum]|uniref:Uncharacterized protein n=1 Tax=Phialemonium thermophilum TaxID=223376 RepID=A0ABR3VS38_9PEZI